MGPDVSTRRQSLIITRGKESVVRLQTSLPERASASASEGLSVAALAAAAAASSAVTFSRASVSLACSAGCEIA